ncbi:MAG: SIR2 family protein [Halothiobacillaceae bacterium]|nr:SIR2 family protein [Halothiobacillaceae bacterium]
MTTTLTDALFETLAEGLRSGTIIPCLGPQALSDVRHRETGAKIPATSDELILAMNNGQPMAPRLMYEFPRAAMHIELKSGRNKVTRFLSDTYGPDVWSPAALHDALSELCPPLVIDLNRDTGLQKHYARRPHTLVVGVARIAGTAFRYRLYRHGGEPDAGYEETSEDGIDPALPVLFKPLGTPWPEANYIASDADFVDYITELMGGFAIPGFLKRFREGKRYLLLGFNLKRDTERMILNDLLYAGAGGWALLPETANRKGERFLERHGLTPVTGDFAAQIKAPASAA